MKNSFSKPGYGRTVQMGGVRSDGEQPNAGSMVMPHPQGGFGGAQPWLPNQGALRLPMTTPPFVPPQTASAAPGAPGPNRVGQLAPWTYNAVSGKKPRADFDRNQRVEDSYVQRYLSYGQGAADAFGNEVGYDLNREIGSILGGLNQIGGLRSGSPQAAINYAMTQYGRSVGDRAAQYASDFIDLGLGAHENFVARNERDRDYKNARKASKLQQIGGAIGTVGGLFL